MQIRRIQIAAGCKVTKIKYIVLLKKNTHTQPDVRVDVWYYMHEVGFSDKEYRIRNYR